jgi:predicted RNA-binding protein YlxR (DUF448 family)
MTGTNAMVKTGGTVKAGQPRAVGEKPRRTQRPGARARRAFAMNLANQRRCVATGESKGREDLVRFVVAPDGSVVPDLEGRLPGRGLWLTPDRAVLEPSKLAGAFARAAKEKVTVAPDLADRLERLLSQRCRDFLGLSRRAGQAVMGYEQVRAFLRDGSKKGVLVAARDGAAGGRDKLRHLAPDLPLVDILESAEIGAAFGTGAVVHAALADGRLAREFLQAAHRLAGLRPSREGAAGTGLRKVEGE